MSAAENGAQVDRSCVNAMGSGHLALHILRLVQKDVIKHLFPFLN